MSTNLSPAPVNPWVEALQRAINEFRSQAEFARQLTTQARRPPDNPITRSHVENWIRRGTGVPSYLAPDVEAISGVSVEELRPDVSWHVIRGKPRKRAKPTTSTAENPPPAGAPHGVSQAAASR